MSGTVVRIGRYRTTSGPDLAVVYDNQQVATFTSPASHASSVILYRGGTWAGDFSGSALARLALLFHASDGSSPNNLRPGGVAAYTGTINPSVAYTGAGEGQQLFANLTAPYLTIPGYEYTVAAANSSGVLGIAMFQASSISEPNEWFYRKDVSGNTPQDAVGSATSNEGQLVVWFEGEVNVAPDTPTGLSPSGANVTTDQTPLLLANFNDDNEVLNNGVEWDRITRTRVWVRVGSSGGSTVFSDEWANSSADQSANRSSITCTTTLTYGQTYAYGVQHQDRGGLWSPIAWTTFSVKDPNDPPLAPDSMTPSGTFTASNTTPSFRFRHRDVSGNTASNRAHIQVETSGGSSRWDFEWAVAVSNGSYITRTYAGSALAYETSYRWRARTRDSGNKWGPFSGWVTFSINQANTAPLAPDQLSPSGAITGDLTPLLSMRHRDPDGNSTSHVTMQVQRVSDSVYMLNKTWAVSIANNGFANSVYDGSGLAFNTNYRFRGRTQDSVGAWGPYSAWVTFSITSLSSVDKPTSPSGYQAGQTPANIVAKYTHNSGVASQAFRVQLLTEAGSVLGTTGWINKTVASGANVTITWAETGFNPRPWGDRSKIRILARDANGVQAPSWSPMVDFNINAAPTIPTGLTPNGSSFSTRPLLVVTNITDADTAQHPKSSLIVKAILTTNAGVFTRTMTWVAARNRWEYQTTATDLPAHSTFQNTWQAYAGDGIVWSGSTTVEASASKSSMATFIYDAVPVVTITGPISPIETALPTITWTSDQPQYKWTVRLFNDSGTKVYEAIGINPNGVHFLISTRWIDGEQWNNGETFDLQVQVETESGIIGTSSLYPILLQYTPPASLPLSGEAISLPQTTQVNAYMLSHDPAMVPNENFEGYEWKRWEIDDAGNVKPETEVPYAMVMNAAITSFLDAQMESGKVYRWGVVVYERRDNDVVASEMETFDGSVQWTGIVIHAPHDPMNTAVELRWSTPDAPYAPSYQWKRSSEEFEAVGGERIFSLGKKLHTDASGSFEVLDDEVATAEQRIETLKYLYQLQAGGIDGIPHTACWRTGRGGSNGIVYGMLIDDPNMTYDDDGWYMLDIGIRSASYTLGVQEEN